MPDSSATLWPGIGIVSAIVFATTWLLAGIMRYLRIGRLDIPNARSSHTTPTPVGGLSIVLTCLVAWQILLPANPINPVTFAANDGMNPLRVLIAGGCVIAILGYIDDCRSLPSAVRLAVHLLCAGIAVYVIGVPSSGVMGHIPAGLLAAVAVPTVAWCLNLYNFMDGIDAIAATETLTVSAGALLILLLSAPAHPAIWVMTILFAAYLAFLFWNKPPARIFMGDAASGFTGFSLAIVALWTTADGVMNIWSWLILLALFVTDATVTLIRRMVCGQALHEAHCGHGYQCSVRLLQNSQAGHYAPEYLRTMAHSRVSGMTGLVNLLWLSPLAVAAHYLPQHGVWFAIAATVPLAAWVFIIQRIAPYHPPEKAYGGG